MQVWNIAHECRSYPTAQRYKIGAAACKKCCAMAGTTDVWELFLKHHALRQPLCSNESGKCEQPLLFCKQIQFRSVESCASSIAFWLLWPHFCVIWSKLLADWKNGYTQSVCCQLCESVETVCNAVKAAELKCKIHIKWKTFGLTGHEQKLPSIFDAIKYTEEELMYIERSRSHMSWLFGHQLENAQSRCNTRLHLQHCSEDGLHIAVSTMRVMPSRRLALIHYQMQSLGCLGLWNASLQF